MKTHTIQLADKKKKKKKGSDEQTNGQIKCQ